MGVWMGVVQTTDSVYVGVAAWSGSLAVSHVHNSHSSIALYRTMQGVPSTVLCFWVRLLARVTICNNLLQAATPRARARVRVRAACE